MWGQANGADFSGINKKTQIKSSNLEIMFYGKNISKQIQEKMV
jgi:hypothetical protein